MNKFVVNLAMILLSIAILGLGYVFLNSYNIHEKLRSNVETVVVPSQQTTESIALSEVEMIDKEIDAKERYMQKCIECNNKTIDECERYWEYNINLSKVKSCNANN